MNNYNYQGFREINPNYENLNNQVFPNYIPNQSSSIPIINNNSNINNNNDNTSYAENILSLNKGKTLRVYMSFSDSIEWRDKVFEGILKAWGKDFLLLFDNNNNKYYMVWNIYINYIEFLEEIIF